MVKIKKNFVISKKEKKKEENNDGIATAKVGCGKKLSSIFSCGQDLGNYILLCRECKFKERLVRVI